MQVQTKLKKETSQVELEITATSVELKPFLEQSAKDLTKKKPLPGFRPGKAPLAVVVEAFGIDHLIDFAIDKAMPRFFVEAVLQENIEALGRPTITVKQASLDAGLAFTALVDVMPEITLGELKTIKLQPKKVQVTDQQVEQELKYLAKTRSSYINVVQPAQEGHTIVVDFEVFMDGQPLPGGSSKNHPVHIGEGHFIPDFEKNVTGMSAGDVREFEMTFPTEFSKQDLQNKKATAKVRAHSVQKRIIPQIDDAFAQSLGKFTDLKQLKDSLKQNMQADLEQNELDRYLGELAEKLADISTISALPESIINREIDRRIEELLRLLTLQKKSLEEYLGQQQKTPAELRQELREPAEKTVKVSLALREYAKKNNIDATAEEVESKLDEYFHAHKTAAETSFTADDIDRLKASIHSTLRHQKALLRLKQDITATT